MWEGGHVMEVTQTVCVSGCFNFACPIRHGCDGQVDSIRRPVLLWVPHGVCLNGPDKQSLWRESCFSSCVGQMWHWQTRREDVILDWGGFQFTSSCFTGNMLTALALFKKTTTTFHKENWNQIIKSDILSQKQPLTCDLCYQSRGRLCLHTWHVSSWPIFPPDASHGFV